MMNINDNQIIPRTADWVSSNTFLETKVALGDANYWLRNQIEKKYFNDQPDEGVFLN